MFEMNKEEILNELTERYPVLSICKTAIDSAFETLKDCFLKGNRIYLCGNGGSAADCDHIVGELLKSFRKKRPISSEYSAKLQQFGDDGDFLKDKLENGLPAISLCSHAAFLTAFANDNEPLLCFAQAISVLGRAGDVLLSISTSGNSKNCLYAVMAAKAKGMKTILLTGRDGGKIAHIADVSVIVPEQETYKIQELHLPVYHCLCAMLESYFFDFAEKSL